MYIIINIIYNYMYNLKIYFNKIDLPNDIINIIINYISSFCFNCERFELRNTSNRLSNMIKYHKNYGPDFCVHYKNTLCYKCSTNCQFIF